MPPVRCTTPLPEKSIAPTCVMVASQPVLSQNCKSHTHAQQIERGPRHNVIRSDSAHKQPRDAKIEGPP